MIRSILLAAVLAPWLLPSLAPCTLLQDEAPVDERWARELDALRSGDDAAIAAAHRAFRAEPDAARDALERAFRDLARRPSPETLPVLIEIVRGYRALGPEAAPAIPFLANSPFLLDEDAMDAWREDGTGEAVSLRNDLWREMRLAIGATGRAGLERLVEGAEADERTEDGVPYTSILHTILPNGAESMATVAEYAFADEESLRDHGRHLARYAEDDLGPYLAARLESDEDVDRDRALVLAGDNLPHSASFLCGLLARADEDLRRGAATAMIRRANPNLLDPDTGEYQGYTTWHGHRFPTTDRPFRVLDALRDEDTLVAVARALEHEDEATRVLAAFLFLRLAEPGGFAPAELRAAASDSSPAVAFWAEEALRRSSAVDDRWLRDLRELPDPPEWGVVESFAERTRDAAESLQSDPDAFAALEPAETCAEAICRLEALRARLRDAWPEDEDALRTHEAIRRREMRRVVRRLDEEAFGQGMGYEALERFGLAALPEFEADYLQDPRFSVGPPTYSDRQEFVLSCGRDALPLIAQSLFHWREGARERCEQALEALDPEDAALAAPIREAAEAWRARAEGS